MMGSRVLHIGILLLLSLQVFGQATVSLTTPKDTLSVGEVVTVSLNINADISQIQSIDFSPIFEIDNLAYQQDTSLLEKKLDVSIIDGGILGINNQNLVLQGDQIKWLKGDLKLAFYSFGAGYLNNPIVKLKNGSEASGLQRSVFFVLPPQSYQNMLDSLQLIDIKPIIEEPVIWTDYLPWLYTLLAIVTFIFLVKYLLKKKNQVDDDFETFIPQPKLPAHVIAKKALKDLDSNQLWQSGKVKQYQSELTRIMRTYIEDRYEVNALEMTSRDLKMALQDLNINDELTKKMMDIMQIADIVKFAKGTAGPELNQRFMEDAHYWVEQTKKIEIVE